MTIAFATEQFEAPAAAAPAPAAAAPAPAAATPAAVTPMTADELVAEAIRCIITGRPFPEHLRAKSPLSPGLESVQHRIAYILAGPSGL
jgi:hypothetical protein